MKPGRTWLLVISSAFLGAEAFGAIRYVDANSTNALPPFTSWATAASNIQAAVNVAQTSDVILVTNGLYNTGGRLFGSSSNRVAVDSKILTIQSVNGPEVTIIQGHQVPGTNVGPSAVRCVYLTAGSVLSGFTLTNGATTFSDGGGGVRCEGSSAVVTNCVLVGNAGAANGGGANSGTLINCKLINNSVVGGSSSGGGANNSTLINCVLAYNFSAYTGGGATSGTMINCTVVSNTAAAYAGSAWNTAFKNCIVYYNKSYLTNSDDSGVYGSWTNCCIPFTVFGANNFTNEPMFADLANGNYHLDAASPCINAGTNSAITNSTDFDGNPRVVGGIVDVGAFEFQSVVHYVRLNSLNPASPYTNWARAAANIQDAIDISAPGDFIVVTNGTYNTGGRAVYGVATNRVVVDKAVTIQSVNGPATTAIAGFWSGGASQYIRCVYLTNGAALMGFTLTNGGSRTIGDTTNEQSGGGAWCESTSAIVSNCVIKNCYANQVGGGAYQGTFYNCTFSNNVAAARGGGAYASMLNNCIVNSNRVTQGFGGGAIYGSLTGCVIMNNSAGGFGGGTYAATVTSCTLSNNFASSGGGGTFFGIINNSLISSNRVSGAGGGASSNTLNNCILINNSTPEGGGGAYRSVLNNCLVISNTAGSAGGGGVGQSTMNNSISLYNSAPNNANYTPTVILNYCCTSPLPTNGLGNITNDPIFINLAARDFHMQSNSPCINAGNNSYSTNATDYDSNPRIVGGSVDIGPFEFQSPGSLLSYAWAQQFGLPTDGSADALDSDGDGLSNWQEWRAGTAPNDASSVLAVAAPSVDASAATITWQSVTNITYYVQRTPDFTTPFSSIQSNIIGQAGTTSYTDTNAASGSFFYRVGVQ
jgi:hypothetical protein